MRVRGPTFCCSYQQLHRLRLKFLDGLLLTKAPGSILLQMVQLRTDQSLMLPDHLDLLWDRLLPDSQAVKVSK